MKNSDNDIDSEKVRVSLKPKDSEIMEEVKSKIEEILDIIDKEKYLQNGEIISIGTTTKKKAHENGDFHKAAHIWIINSKGEVLIQKRAEMKDSHPGLWDISAAGHIGIGESMKEGALRELKEELGVELDADELGRFEKIFEFTVDIKKEMRGKPWHNNEVNYVYVLRADLEINTLKLQEEEVEELRYISIEEFENEIIDDQLKKRYVPVLDDYYQRVIAELKKRSDFN